MIRRYRSVLLGGLLAAVATGCLEDKAAKERTQVQAALAAATAQLRVATIAPVNPQDDSAASVEVALDSVIRRLSQLSGGEPGQRAAKGLLAATAHRELAVMDHERADAVEQQHRYARTVLRGKLDASLDLESLAGALEAPQAADELAMLDDAEAETNSELALVSEVIAALDEPIAERKAANSSDSREVDQLRQDVDAKLRRAAEAGHADGFATYEEAIDLRRQADEIEFEIGWRETELGHQLQPQHDMATQRAGQLQAEIAAIDQGRASIQALAATNIQEAGANRQAANALADEIEAGIDAITESSNTDLAASYESAAAHLDQAATLASQAARQAEGDATESANLVVARIYEQQGRLRADQVRGLADQQALLARLVEVGAPGDRYQAVLNNVTTRLSEAQQAGQDAFQKASEALESVRIRRLESQLQALKQNISAASAALVGGATPIAIVAPTAPSTPSAPAGGTPASTGQGFESPETLAQFLVSVDQADIGDSMRALDATRGTTPESRAFIEASRALGVATQDFMAAWTETFGGQFADQVQSMAGANAAARTMNNITIQSQSDDRATVTYTNGLGQTQTVDFVKQDGAWFLDGASLVTMMEGMMPGGTGVDVLMGTTQAMARLMQTFAPRIRAGEFANEMEAMTAFGQATQEALARLGQGMPGIPQQ